MSESSAYQQLLTRYQQAQQQVTSCMFRHPWRSMTDTLHQLAQTAEPFSQADVYGSGELITELEQDVAAILGKPAALFLPSGTLAHAAKSLSAQPVWPMARNFGRIICSSV